MGWKTERGSTEVGCWLELAADVFVRGLETGFGLDGFRGISEYQQDSSSGY